uniref:Si:dkey-9i23.5 n=1 Tax=Oncorhynchus kisutch TaxID=8019 RepID=A0A8C7FUQ6_ONCKI
MKFVSLIVMMSLLGTKMALTFHRSTGGDDAPVYLQEETAECDMPKACDLKNYEDWYRLGSYCIKYFKAALNFTEAETQCRSAAPGGHLVSVHNCQANDNLLCVVMKNNAKNPRIWLGGFELFQTQCRSAAPGGHLVSVHNSQANANLLCVVMKNNAKSPRIWLGGFELFKSGKFVWTDGSSWNFEAWTPGEPISRWTSREDCVEMNWSKIGKWNDHTCFTKKSYVCSFKNRV